MVTIEDAKRLCRQLEIKIISTADRPGPMRTSAVNTIRRMLADFGQGHTVTTLRAIVEGNAANRTMLQEYTLKAVGDVVRAHPGWVQRGMEWLEAWDGVDLVQIRNSAKASGIRPLRFAIAAMVWCLRLTEILGPSVLPKPKRVKAVRIPKPPRSLSRIPEVERNLALGKQLIELRSQYQWNIAFGRAVRQQFPDIDSSQACDLAKVARAYGDRSDIYRRLSWNALVELSSSSIRLAVRTNLEARILAGEAVTDPDIRHARGKLKSCRPKRSSDQPVQKTAVQGKSPDAIRCGVPAEAIAG